MLHRPRRTQNGKWPAGYRGVRLCGSCKYAKLPYRLRKSQRPPRPQQSNHRSRSAVIHIRAPWRRIIRGQRVIAARTLPALPRNCAPDMLDNIFAGCIPQIEAELEMRFSYRHFCLPQSSSAGFPRVTSKTPHGRVFLTDRPARIRLPRPAQGPPIYEPSSLLLVLW